MKITILAVGKMRDRAAGSLCDDYLKRARRHLPVQVVECRSDGELERRLDRLARVVLLDAGGRTYDSEGFARWLEQQMTHGRTDLSFVIGGADGFSDTLRGRGDETLSLGPMTLPHRLARVVLTEQIYRALSILRGEPYHK